MRILEPDGASRLSDGALVEAHLDARLLGMRVLRVDGTVQLAPGHLVEPPRVVTDERPRKDTAPAAGALAPGGDLARAAQLLAENRARLDGSGPDRRGPGS